MQSYSANFVKTQSTATISGLGNHRRSAATTSHVKGPPSKKQKKFPAAGLEPAPTRGQGQAWNEFLKTHWEVLAATDFFKVELWTAKGLIRYHVLVVINLATREAAITGLVPEPSESWMAQVTRNLVDP